MIQPSQFDSAHSLFPWTVLGNIVVGEGAQVAAGSLVLKPVAPHTMVGSKGMIVAASSGSDICMGHDKMTKSDMMQHTPRPLQVAGSPAKPVGKVRVNNYFLLWASKYHEGLQVIHCTAP